MKFTVLTKENACKIISLAQGKADEDILKEIFNELLCMSEEERAEVAVYINDDFLFVRIFDMDRYIFPFPIPLSDTADVEGCRAALLALAEYTKREMIPFYISDIDRASLDILTELFVYVDAAATLEDEDVFSAEVLNEASRLTDFPQRSDGVITLKELSTEFADDYYRLVTDKEVEKFWGYDFRIDTPQASGEELILMAKKEFDLSVAISLGIYIEDKFVGEGVIFNFDYRGGAELAIRVLPEYRRGGVGVSALKLLIDISLDIGLKSLVARVKKENIPSIKMTGRHMNKLTLDNETVLFSLEI